MIYIADRIDPTRAPYAYWPRKSQNKRDPVALFYERACKANLSAAYFGYAVFARALRVPVPDEFNEKKKPRSINKLRQKFRFTIIENYSIHFHYACPYVRYVCC